MSALPNLEAPAALGSQAAWNAYAAIRGARGQDQLDQACRAMWQACSSGAISEADATFLQSAVNERRPPAGGARLQPGTGSRASRFPPRKRVQRPDYEASVARRRMLGSSNVLPAHMRAKYTLGQMAVLCIIVGAVKRNRRCDFPIAKIAALAGVCRATVHTTLKRASALGHIKVTERPRPGQKHLTHIIEIVSPEWLTWIKLGPPAHVQIGSNFVTRPDPTKSEVVKSCTVAAAAASQGALRSRMGARSSPPLRR